MVSIISDDGVPGYPETTLTPAESAPSAIAPLPITYSFFMVLYLVVVVILHGKEICRVTSL